MIEYQKQNSSIIINATEKAYKVVTLEEPDAGVLEIQKVVIEGFWEFSEMSIAGRYNYSNTGTRRY